MKISIMFLTRESFPLQLYMESFIHFPRILMETEGRSDHGVLTHSLPQRILGLKVDENQRKVFNQREFSSAIIHGSEG